MSKQIHASPDDFNAFEARARKELDDKLSELKGKRFKFFSDMDISLRIQAEEKQNKKSAFLKFTSEAWLKVITLVDSFSTEVQWHGLVKRESPNTFLVYDIMCFPHTASAVTVTSDQEKYEEWSLSLPDEVRKDMKCHGHSHVNMAVTPSRTDDEYRFNVVKNMGYPDSNTDLFYVFFITNKRRDISVEIFDIQNNVRYGTGDIVYDVIMSDGSSLFAFQDAANDVVTLPVKTTSFQEKSGSYLHKKGNEGKYDIDGYLHDEYYGKYKY